MMAFVPLVKVMSKLLMLRSRFLSLFLPLVFNLLFGSTNGWAFGVCSFDDFPTMDDMKTSNLLNNAVQNNRPLMVRGFIIEAEVVDVQTFYSKRWEGQVDHSTYGPWRQITTITDKCMMTVQVASKALGGSHGRLVISNLPGAAANQALGTDLIRPADAEVISDLKTDDGFKTGRLSVLTSSQSPSRLKQFYADEYINDGWTFEREFSEGAGTVIVFRRGVETANVLLLKGATGTQILINQEDID